MSITYNCKKCNFTCTHYNCMYNHVSKKKQCQKNIEAYKYSDDQLLVLSLLPYDKNNEKDVEHLNKSDIIYKNKDKLLSMIDYINKNKIKKCVNCNKDFLKMSDLKHHYITSCFYEDINKNVVVPQNNMSIDGDNNTMNISNSNNTHITNIYLEIKNPIPFDEDWDISKIDEKTKTSLLFSKIMYTGLLDEILKNEINLNIIIDKNNESGMVYKNDIDQYIQMKSQDIVSNAMAKLRKHLLDINESSISLEDCLKLSKKTIEKKHEDYIKYENTKNIVNDYITGMFDKKKEDAIKVSSKVLNKKNNQIQHGF